YRSNLGNFGDSPQAHSIILRGGGGSWILRAFVGMGIVRRALQGPSIQVTIHRAGANDSADQDCQDLTWDDVSEGDYEALFGYIQGLTREQDKYLFPTDQMLEEFWDHYYREWNPFCDQTFKHIKEELDDKKGKARTRSEWKHYFQSSNRGVRKPKVVVNWVFIEEGIARDQEAMKYTTWNKRRIRDLARDIPAQFLNSF
ncbi:hypothetical protein B0H13DRAFT_1650379, partial [Mycena leptocephala]